MEVDTDSPDPQTETEDMVITISTDPDVASIKSKCSETSQSSNKSSFQAKSKYLQHLPIPQKIWEADADEFLNQIKSQLTAAVLMLDIKQGARHWAQQLQKYIKIYGVRLTKKDHIDLVKLLFELIITPEQECSVTNAFVSIFNRLLRKKHLLSPEDLTLPWKPVYELWKALLNNKDDSHGRLFLPPYVESMVTEFVKSCRTFFPPESTQELLTKFKPYMCPFDSSMNDAFELLELFLPTTGPVDQHDKMYPLWFDEFMGLYKNLDASRLSWESKIFSLFSRLSGHNIGLIDWEPHIPHIFARILKAFGLPVGPAKYHLSHADPSYEFSSSFLWVVAMITPTNSAMSHIAQFIRTVEPFLHPSNHGWSQRGLQAAISKLCQMFTARIKLERYKKPSWDNYVPEDQKLTDDQITEFVDLLKPVIFTGLFSKHGPQDMVTALFNVAALRPERIIPQHLENLYQALDNLTEPHRLKATLSAMLGVTRLMLSHHDRYPEGRLQVIPILQLCLPGIDSNDSNKTILTLQLIAMLTNMTLLVDCSEAYQLRTDLTDIEKELCSQTAQFQDFIFIFIDRIFSLIEGLSLDHHESAAARSKASLTEAMIESAVRGASVSVFQHTSTALFKLSFEKVWNYLSSKVFEVLVAGKLAIGLLMGLVRTRPTITLPHVAPFCCKKILELTENPEVLTDERPDNSLLWYLLIFSECFKGIGEHIVEYAEDVQAVLDRTLHMTNTMGHLFSCNLLHNFLYSVNTISSHNLNAVEKNLNAPLTEYLPIRDWGLGTHVDKMELTWDMPSEESMKVVQSMFSKIMLNELKYLDEHENCDREDLQRRLKIIMECLKSVGFNLPAIQSEEYAFENEGIVDRSQYSSKQKFIDYPVTLEGENARNRVLRTIQPLMAKLLSKDDSAKPLLHIAAIYMCLLLDFGVDLDLVNNRAKNISSFSRSLDNPLESGKCLVRLIHTEKANIQLCRLVHHQTHPYPFTQLHSSIYQDLVLLATSRYDNVQSTARTVLAKCFHAFKSTQRLVIPSVCQLLITPPPEVTEEQFKGALGLVYGAEGSGLFGGSAYHCLAILRNMGIQRQLWPAIIQAQHSEKPVIQKTVDKIVKRIEKKFETICFHLPVSEGSREAAETVRSSVSLPDVLDLPAGQQAAGERADKYIRLYKELRTELLSLVGSDVLQWKHKEFAMEMIAFLQRPDLKPSTEEITLFSKRLVDESISVRKLAIGVVTGLLYSQKQKHPKEYVPSEEFNGYESLQYNPNDVPDTEEKWVKTNFVEKTYWGCTGWPEKVPVSRCHPPPPPEELGEEERIILSYFSDQQFTDTFFKYLALPNKEKDRFSSPYYNFFKGLARNYGPAIVESCKLSIEKLQNDTDHLTESSRQRVVAEFVAGIVRGSKYWSFKQMNELFDWLLPTVKRAITNVSDEAKTHWGTAIATCAEDREPRKLYRLYQFLLDEVLAVGDDNSSATSLQTTSRLYFLQAALGQQQWRIPELNTFTTQLIRERLASPFKSIRSRLGSVLCSCYIFDIPYINKECWHNPARSEFINSCLPLIKDLADSSDADLGASDIDSNQATPKEGGATPVSGQATPTNGVTPPITVDSALAAIQLMEIESEGKNGVESESDENKLVFKTVLSWLNSNFERHTMYQRWTPEILQFLPIICLHTANYSDPELRSLCKTTAKYMSKTLLPSELVPNFLHIIKEAIGLNSWHARTTILEILQSMIFINQFTLSAYCQQLQDIIVHLLSDERMEVKLMAATTLSGGIQCQFFSMDDNKLLNHFKRLSNVRLKSKGNKVELLQRCHTGLLGLGAVVRAYPYVVPNFVPELLMILSDHVHDPQPVQKTVKDILSEFKRTHHDNWMDHKQKFTDDQLVVLTNLLVSPNYYA